ncbi:hypothetical protein ACET3Z_025900 [Daucus carota]
MSSRSTQTTAAQMRVANEEAASNAAFDVLNNMEQVVPGSELYNCAGQEFLANKNNQEGQYPNANNQDALPHVLVYVASTAGQHDALSLATSFHRQSRPAVLLEYPSRHILK